MAPGSQKKIVCYDENDALGETTNCMIGNLVSKAHDFELSRGFKNV